jgi:hypothetical protein
LKSKNEIILAYQEARNAHDIDLVLSYLSPDIRFGMAGLWVKQGHEEIRTLEEWDAVHNSQTVFENLKMRNQRLECKATETNDWYQMVGISSIKYDSIKFEFDLMKINHIRAKMSPKSERQIDQVINDILRWALKAHPDKIDDLIPRGQFVYGREQAKRWKVLIDEWQHRR